MTGTSNRCEKARSHGPIYLDAWDVDIKRWACISMGAVYGHHMIATLSPKGETVIPKSVRDAASLRPGDRVEVGYANGMVILRKRIPLTKTKVESLFKSGKKLPTQTDADEAEVMEAVRRVRARRK